MLWIALYRDLYLVGCRGSVVDGGGRAYAPNLYTSYHLYNFPPFPSNGISETGIRVGKSLWLALLWSDLEEFVCICVNAGPDISQHVPFLFPCMTTHGSVPNEFGVSTILPIPKSNNSNSIDSANFRGIALSSIFCKLLDIIILE